MPKADLPTTPFGWIVAAVASVVGLVASFAFLMLLERVLAR